MARSLLARTTLRYRNRRQWSCDSFLNSAPQNMRVQQTAEYTCWYDKKKLPHH